MFSFEENRQEDVGYHDEWQRHETEDGEADDGQCDENEAHFVAFPFQVFHLEREEPQVTHHHKGKNEHDADAVAQPKAAVAEVPDLCQSQRQRCHKNSHAWGWNAAERSLLRVVDIEFCQADGRENGQQESDES